MRYIALGMFAAVLASAVSASDMGTPEEAKTMSLQARTAVNEMGRERAFAAFADPNGEFRDRDLYVFCIDMEDDIGFVGSCTDLLYPLFASIEFGLLFGS